MEIGINDCEKNYSVEYFLSKDCKDSTQGIEIKNGSTMVIKPLCTQWINKDYSSEKEEDYNNLVNAINKQSDINTLEIQVLPFTPNAAIPTTADSSVQKVYPELYSFFFDKLTYVTKVVYVPADDGKSEKSEFKLFFNEGTCERERTIRTRDKYGQVYSLSTTVNELNTLVLVSNHKKIFIAVSKKAGGEYIIYKRSDNINDYDTIFFREPQKNVKCSVEVCSSIGLQLTRKKIAYLSYEYPYSLAWAFANSYNIVIDLLASGEQIDENSVDSSYTCSYVPNKLLSDVLAKAGSEIFIYETGLIIDCMKFDSIKWIEVPPQCPQKDFDQKQQELLDKLFWICIFKNIKTIFITVPAMPKNLFKDDLYRLQILSSQFLTFLKKLYTLVPVQICFRAYDINGERNPSKDPSGRCCIYVEDGILKEQTETELLRYTKYTGDDTPIYVHDSVSLQYFKEASLVTEKDFLEEKKRQKKEKKRQEEEEERKKEEESIDDLHSFCQLLLVSFVGICGFLLLLNNIETFRLVNFR